MATAITVNELPLPEEDPIAWAVIWISGLPCPGYYLCTEADGERERDTQHQKSKGSSRDILVDQGLMPKSVRIRIKTTTADIFRALYDFYLKYMDPERPLSRLNIVTVSHPQLYSRGIKMGYFKKAGLPKPTRAGGKYPMVSDFEFNVVGPKTQIGASGGATKPKQQNGIGGPTDPVFQTQQQRAAVTAISAVAAEQRASMKLVQSRPANQKAVLYTPADITKLANAGDPSASFINDYIASAAPR